MSNGAALTIGTLVAIVLAAISPFIWFGLAQAMIVIAGAVGVIVAWRQDWGDGTRKRRLAVSGCVITTLLLALVPWYGRTLIAVTSRPSQPASVRPSENRPADPHEKPAAPTPKPSKTPSSALNLPAPSIHVEQKSEGTNSPNVITFGANSPVNINTPLPPRRIRPEDRVDIRTFLSRRPGKVQVAAIMNDPEAYQFATDLLAVLKDAGWDMANPPVVRVFIAVGQPPVGVAIKFHGEPVTGGSEITIPDTEPVYYLLQTLKKLNVHGLVGSRDPKYAEDLVVVEVGRHPE